MDTQPSNRQLPYSAQQHAQPSRSCEEAYQVPSAVIGTVPWAPVMERQHVEDVSCAKAGCLLSTCFPFVGWVTYFPNSNAPAGSEMREWADRACGTGTAVCCLAFVHGL